MKTSPTATIVYQSPGLPRVFAAMVYDSLLLTAISLAYGALVVGGRVLLGGAPAAGQRIHWDLLSSILISLGWFALLVCFYVYFWHRFGQTLGMKTWRIQMLDAATYQRATYRQCIIRSFAAILSMALLGLGYWSKFFHPQGKMLQDLLSGTTLVLLKK